MKVIFFKVDLRLNPHDEHEVISETFIPYSEENVEYAIEHSVDGQYHIEDIEEPEPEQPEVPSGDDSVWAELDAAYQEGVDSV